MRIKLCILWPTQFSIWRRLLQPFAVIDGFLSFDDDRTILSLAMFGTDSDQNRITWGNPQKWFSDSLPLLLGQLGVCTPYATRRKLRYEANQVWMNTTFISQGPQSWGKLAVETWQVKTELIIITILHIIIITTSILNLGFKTFAPKILAHTKCGA